MTSNNLSDELVEIEKWSSLAEAVCDQRVEMESANGIGSNGSSYDLFRAVLLPCLAEETQWLEWAVAAGYFSEMDGQDQGRQELSALPEHGTRLRPHDGIAGLRRIRPQQPEAENSQGTSCA